MSNFEVWQSAQSLQDEPEQILLRFRQHGSKLFWPVIALLLTGFLGGFYLGSFAAGWQNVLLALGLGILLFLGFLVPFSAWFAARSTVTTKRVVVRSGVFTRVKQEVAINRVRSLSTRKSLWQRILRSGNIEIYIAGSDDPLILGAVPGVADIAEVLQQLVEASYLQDRAQTGFYNPVSRPSALSGRQAGSFGGALPQQPAGQQATGQQGAYGQGAPGFRVQRKL